MQPEQSGFEHSPALSPRGDQSESRSIIVRGAILGLGSAILWGLSAPLAKLILRECDALVLAALLYLGAGLGLVTFDTFSRVTNFTTDGREARLRREDVPALAAITILGGILAPVLMLDGLDRLSAVAGSLLLNLEAPFAVLIAVMLFGEHLGSRPLSGVALIVIGAGALGTGSGDFRASAPGVAMIAGACFCWAVDSNLTQRLSLRNPSAIVRIKALAAGSASLCIALLRGLALPRPEIFAASLALGSISYGVSLILYIHAMRILGAARQAGFLATAPFVGALAAIPILNERFTIADLAAAALMTAGVALLLGEKHDHLHLHEPLEHDHVHLHDLHHQHEHGAGIPVDEPHAHWHRHEPLLHSHPHVSDLHHRHRH